VVIEKRERPVEFTDPSGLQLVKEDPNESLSSEDRTAVLEYMNPGATGRAEAKREAIEKAVSDGVEEEIGSAEGYSVEGSGYSVMPPPSTFYRFGVSLKVAVIFGAGIEAGVTYDTLCNYGLYGSLYLGTGIQIGLSDPKTSIGKQVLDTLFGGGGSGASGTIMSGNGIGFSADGGVGAIATWDLNNPNGGLPSGVGGIGFGGGVWKSWSGAIKLFGN
jgi:hypothetical protein